MPLARPLIRRNSSHASTARQQAKVEPLQSRRLVVSLLAGVAILAPASAQAATITLTVTTLSDNFTTPVAGSLREALNSANADPNNNYVINFNVAGGGTLNLAANAAGARMLPILTNPSGISINGANTLGGGAITIGGGSTSSTTGDRIFFVGVAAGTPAQAGGNLPSTAATAFSISNLTLANGNARGGNAESTRMGGGGAGLGGALFVNAGTVTLDNVLFSGNGAIGGIGGTGGLQGGAGGGMGGNSSGALGGGGGFGLGANGSNTSAGSGRFTGGKLGGAGNAGALGGVDGGSGGGGSGGGSIAASGGGGIGGGNASSGIAGSGGFGGGGGANGSISGNGGFGGGGGSGAGGGTGGLGGFGGGGGGGGPSGGAGGFGGGAGNPSQAGGGLAAGGGVFVRQGATLNITGGGFTGGTLTAGTGVNPGQAIGSALFLAGSANYSVSNANTVTIADTLGGGTNALITGGFTKSGAGKLVLSGANTYTGGTTVTGGTLLANNTTGSATGTGNVTVNNLATFGGTGAITGVVVVNSGGTAAPGASIESLNVGGLSLTAATSTLAIEIDLTSPAADLLNVINNGGVSLSNSTLDLSLLNPATLALPRTYLIVANDGGLSDLVSGSFGTVVVPAGYSALVVTTFLGTDFLGRTGDGNDIAITVSVVPEPASLGLLCLAGVGLLRRRADTASRQAAE